MTKADVEGARRHIGEKLGGWTIVGTIPRGRRALYLIECDGCRARRVRSFREFVRGQRCAHCNPGRGMRLDPARVEQARAVVGMPRIDADLPYDHDVECQRLIEDRGPLTLEETGAAFGVTRERIRQIEASAIRKLLRAFRTIAAAASRRTGLPEHEIFADLVDSLRTEQRPETPLGSVTTGTSWARMHGTQWTTPPPERREHEGPASAEVRRLDAILSDVEARAERVTSRIRKL